ncbi:competence/damage-inducible protein A [Bacillus sp. S10(2024)]|uniref:competence/damage-inducible protein A n=1 Tax=Bacillus sp. S10(2024) TaxID=3162886 RepID=UPI003D208C58
METVSIITVGSEVTNGNILNTNGQWLSKQLTDLGFKVQSITSVLDNPPQITEVIKYFSNYSKYIIITGGLGATHDDTTRTAFDTLFDLSWCCDRKSWEKVNQFMNGWGIASFPYEAYKQTMIPSESLVLPNEKGTAPGFYMQKDDIHYICLPGVPNEMEEIFSKYVQPIVNSKSYKNNKLTDIMLYGVTEEEVSRIIDPILSESKIEYAILVNEGMIQIEIFLKQGYVDTEVNKLLYEIKSVLSPWCYSYHNISVEEAVSKKLAKKKIYIYDNALGGICSYLLYKKDRRLNLFSEVFIGRNEGHLYDHEDVNIDIKNISSQENTIEILVTIQVNGNVREFRHSVSSFISVPLKRLGRQVLVDLQNVLKEEEIKSNEYDIY